MLLILKSKCPERFDLLYSLLQVAYLTNVVLVYAIPVCNVHVVFVGG